MTTDAQRVLALLRTTCDWMRVPANKLYATAKSGEFANKTKTCGQCGGSGKIGRRVKHPCPGCHASCSMCEESGRVSPDCCGTGKILFDAYTEQTSSERVTEQRRERIVNCDSCGGQGVHGNGKRCLYCDGTGKRLAVEITTDELEEQRNLRGVAVPFGVVDSKAWLYAKGDYANLDDALFLLAVDRPVLHRFVMGFVVYGGGVEPGQVGWPEVERACELLAQLMPKPIRVPQWAKAEPAVNGKGRWANGHAQNGRNAQVRQLREQGLSLTKIGVRVGLTKQRVSQILNEEAA